MQKQLLDIIIKTQALADNCKDHKTIVSLHKIIKELWVVYRNL